ncbi:MULTISPECIES: DGQHR domain-containing protein [Acinetobacter]|uniref:DGQHR domain-containing protein n=1 Tax=Acinetobacter genomosp. 15BJ TaxID=106651 RepID=R9B606_9GAMM|nr:MULTISPECIES: DGQHR domain-containing protein [Acinetobacter]EOR09852.1 hypothetical protein F896_00881 [Acinetobacter genomosp. 15BJ]MCH7292121.1 DGQHR domain-containing protein [Acinetobacter genomosp. 15BJ]MCI3880888.1 DGQHR domain-containing protein [Acinetobacter higginsii]MDO3656935.1 DGQHR domain-containing protein [Acinetobacter genomosp. 15BJ]
MKLKYFVVNQPIGTFYLSVINASDLIGITDTLARTIVEQDNVQRESVPERINAIANYCTDPDATFPTAVIISVYQENFISIDDEYLVFKDNVSIGEIIDGQHRLLGIEKSGLSSKFDLPVVFMFDLDSYQKGYVFSIINSKQTRVPMSKIYDLFALNPYRSPYKTCHDIVKTLNRNVDSPFYNRIKMLGKKEVGQEKASLSQAAFINYLLPLISKNPDKDSIDIKNHKPLKYDDSLLFRKYFIEEKDELILKVLLNYFGAISEVFYEQWNNPEKYILSKPIGYGALLKHLPLYLKYGFEHKDLREDFFIEEFQKLKDFLDSPDSGGVQMTSEFFGSNEQSRTKLANLIREAIL